MGYTINCGGRLLDLDIPLVMGIINATPDSFYAGSRKQMIADVLLLAKKMLGDGAAILDIGGQSTRPGAHQVGEEAELERVLPVIDRIKNEYPQAIISIDTYRSKVARLAVEAGASIINDIGAGSLDTDMLATVAALRVPYIAMHNKGLPETMQKRAVYEDVTLEILDFFIERIAVFKEIGINDVIIDPGFGFGKTIAHNFTLLSRLNIFKMLDRPMLVGISRKSFIYRTLDTNAENALTGTIALQALALERGANILRVHDVKEAVETVKLIAAFQGVK